MDRFKILLGGLLFVYLILDGYQSHFFSFYLAAILIIGLGMDWYWGRSAETIRSFPPVENSIFQVLSNLMLRNQLEMRLRRADPVWNVTLVKNTNGVIRLAARGSAPSISEAIMRAEGDFEKRNEPEAS